MATLTTYVAINTLVFLGLSLAKGIRWPPPLHPVAVRSRTNPADETGRATTRMERTMLWGLVAVDSARRAARGRKERT